MKKLNLLMSVVLSLMLAACASSSTSRSTGRTIDDAAITAKVKHDIAAATGLGEALAVNVDTYRGEVSLSGFVNTQEQARQAGLAAEKEDGVTRVINNIQVKPQPNQP